ncbi:SGNH/GDSL hydrolase family protein [uncultured Sulfitobacter sp.]|uniref:SGNH/GDSL hydrolase family protein n=1 Tax=uncultured Sulfitobacter sp. TaxID=191468 RepID=UPI002611DF38|nr:SGNH/GDSL hydrolase family protein [uncultured Sulfitobacter sp.]
MILDAVIAAGLSPVLLVQAVRLRKRALLLPEAAGLRTGSTGSGTPLRVLIIGDSSAAGVGAEHQDAALAGQLALALAPHRQVTWQLVARTGATTADTFAGLDGIALEPADVAIIVLGVNDVTRGGPLPRWRRTHARLRSTIQQRTGARTLYISQIPPLGRFPLLPHPLRWLLGRRSLRFDTALRGDLAKEPHSRHVLLPDTLDPNDMARDGFHPGPRIYALWAKEMAHRILSDGP